MNEYEVKPEEQEFKIEIGDNLLKAIKSIVNATEKENERRGTRKLLHPGNEVQIAFGINITKIHKDHIDNKKYSDGEGRCPECEHRFLHHPECKSGCVFVDRRR